MHRGKRVLYLFTAAALIITGCGRSADTADRAIVQYMKAQTGGRKDMTAADGDGTLQGSEEDKNTLPAMSELPEEKTVPVMSGLPDGEMAERAMYAEGVYCYYNGEYYGYVAEDGKRRKVPCIYEEAWPFSEGLACVYLDGKYGYIGKDGETVLPFVYDQASPFMEGLAYFSRGEEYGFMDRDGNVVLEPDCDSVSSFQEGLAYFSVDGRYGYMDKNGRTVIEPVYDDAGYFQQGTAIIMKNGRYGMIGKDGTEILAPKYNDIRREESCLIVWQGEKCSFLDKTGREISSGTWNMVWASEGMFCIMQDKRYGLVDGKGRLLLEPVYSYVRPIYGGKLIIVQDETGAYGVLDHSGQTKVPFIYSQISETNAESGCLCVKDADTGKVGCLDGKDFSECIPLIYDELFSFTGERAVVGLDGKYGVIRYDGTLEIPPKYDRIALPDDGTVALWTGAEMELYDDQGNLIYSGCYNSVRAYESCYLIEADSGNRIVDRSGNVLISYFSDKDPVYGMEGAYILDGNILVRTAAEESDMDKRNRTELLLFNQITPRVGQFLDFLKNGSFTVETDGPEMTREPEMLRPYRRFCKLYRTGNKGELTLYYYAAPWEQFNFPESYSGLFLLRNGRVETLLTGYECGGSLRGDYVCFWYDTKDDVRKPGIEGSWGGFGGTAYGGEVYELQNGEAVLNASFGVIHQVTGNYSSEELEQNAELFYDEEGIPYTKETIAEAESVLEYSVNEKQTSAEDYEAVKGRYQYLSVLDRYF